MNEVIDEAIKALVARAKNQEQSLYAMQYAQAALNLMQAKATLDVINKR